MNLSKLKFLIFASFITLIFIGCSSEQETIETLQSQSTTINLDNSLDEAIQNSLENYQAVVVVFYRGHFWGICRAQLGELSQNHALFKRFGIDIIAISTDDQENTQAMIDEVNASFEIISDSKKMGKSLESDFLLNKKTFLSVKLNEIDSSIFKKCIDVAKKDYIKGNDLYRNYLLENNLIMETKLYFKSILVEANELISKIKITTNNLYKYTDMVLNRESWCWINLKN